MFVTDQVLKGMEEESVRFLYSTSFAKEGSEFDFIIYYFLISGMRVQIQVEEDENGLDIFSNLNMEQHHPRISSRYCKVMDSIQQAYKEIIEQKPSLRLKYVTGEYTIQVARNKS